MTDILCAGSQILLATSPILAALPGATLLQLDRPIRVKGAVVYDPVGGVLRDRLLPRRGLALGPPQPGHRHGYLGCGQVLRQLAEAAPSVYSVEWSLLLRVY